MGNIFHAYGTTAEEKDLSLSNGGTDVFYDVLALAACALAQSPWERNLAVFFGDGHRMGRGCDGFDLNELPWTADWPAEKTFLLRVLDLAMTRHGWERLDYTPPYAMAYLRCFRAMLEGWPAPVPVYRPGGRDDWRVPPPPEQLERCAEHAVHQGMLGCRLCEP